MAFGKRPAADAPRILKADDDADVVVSAPGVGAVRTRVVNQGEIDRNFIALAIGVVVLSAGAALAAPSLMSAFGGGGARSIAEVIAGLDRQAARTALAHEAFPDEDGRAFMTSLATHFPAEHGRLLDTLADSAMGGGDRDDLFAGLNYWASDFALDHIDTLGRTGADGFDTAIHILGDALKLVEAEAGGCSANKIEAYFLNPDALGNLTRYGGRGYSLSMRASRDFVDLAARGRSLPPATARLNANDMNALQSTFMSMMGDSQVIALIQAASMAGPGNADFSATLGDSINICQLGRTVLIKLEGLPAGTKARMLSTALSGDAAGLMGPGGFSVPFGPRGSGGLGFLP